MNGLNFFFTALTKLFPFLKGFFKRGSPLYDAFSGKDDTKIISIRERSKNKAAILFLHGFGGNAEDTWGKFPSFFKEDDALRGWDIYSIGYNSKLTPDIEGIWSSNPNITALAHFLKTLLINRFGQNYTQIGIAAHSMGGLVAQRAILDIKIEQQDIALIHSLTLFGTPSNGLKKALLGKTFNKQVNDMALGSLFLKKLREDWQAHFGSEPPFKFLTCAGDIDDFVPSSSSLDPFPRHFRKRVNGNHATIVKPTDKTDLSCSVFRKQFVSKENFYKGDYDSADIAIQLGDFQRVLDKLEANKEELRGKHAADYVLALEALDNHQAAIDYLEQYTEKHPEDTDIIGILAGRFKRLYMQGFKEDDLAESERLYQKAYELAFSKEDAEQVYYSAINLAFLNLCQKQYDETKRYAKIAIEYAEKSRKDDLWKYATLAEAALYLEEKEKAFLNYAIALEKVEELWQKDSMHRQWFAVVEHLGMTEMGERLKKLFRDWKKE